MSQGTGMKTHLWSRWGCCFLRYLLNRSLSMLFPTTKGQCKRECSHRHRWEILFPWFPADCLPRGETGLLPLCFIPWWCIPDNCKPHFQGKPANCGYSINIKPPQQFGVSPFALCFLERKAWLKCDSHCWEKYDLILTTNAFFCFKIIELAIHLITKELRYQLIVTVLIYMPGGV